MPDGDQSIVEWLTIPEVALRLRVSKMTVYRICAKGEIIHYQIGRQVRIKADDFAAYLTAARQDKLT